MTTWTLDAIGRKACGPAWEDAEEFGVHTRSFGLDGVWRWLDDALEDGAPPHLVAAVQERVHLAKESMHIGVAVAPGRIRQGERDQVVAAGLADAELHTKRLDVAFEQAALPLGLDSQIGPAATGPRCRTCGGLGRAVALLAGGKLATRRQAHLWQWRAGEATQVTVDCWRCRGSQPARWWWPRDGRDVRLEPRGRWAPWEVRR